MEPFARHARTDHHAAPSPLRPRSPLVFGIVLAAVIRSVASREPADGDLRKAFAAAIVLHVLLAAVVLLMPPAPFPTAPAEPVVEVSVVAPPEAPPSAPPQPAAPSPAATPPPSPPPPTAIARPEAPDTMIQADRLFSGRVLADPRSRNALRALAGFSPDERIVQLCGIEAQEQIHRWKAELQPDMVIAYAMAELKLSPHEMQAEGGAFRSKRRWYNVSFDCRVSDDLQSVVAFAFKVGGAIPEGEWESHNLVADDGPED